MSVLFPITVWIRKKNFYWFLMSRSTPAERKKKSCNLIFLPPLGIRFFDVDVLAPYAVEADQMLIYRSTYAVADRA